MLVPSGNQIITPTLAQENGSLTFTHPSTTADPANYYYVVRAANASPAESVNSNRTGKFIFPLVPGSQ